MQNGGYVGGGREVSQGKVQQRLLGCLTNDTKTKEGYFGRAVIFNIFSCISFYRSV